MDFESALQALCAPSHLRQEEGATFLALMPRRDERAAQALRSWLEEWLRVHGQPTTLYGKFVTDEATGMARLVDAPKHKRPAPCLLALGTHGSASDDALLARFSSYPASTLARCRLLGKAAPSPLAIAALELFRTRNDLRAGRCWTTSLVLRYWVDVLISIASAAPLQIVPMLRELLPSHFAEGERDSEPEESRRLDATQIARVACAIIETTLPLAPQQPVPASAPGRIVIMVSKVFRDIGIPESVESALKARGLPATSSDFEAWLRTHPGSVAREQLAARLSELASQPVPQLRNRGAMCYSPVGAPDRCEYMCPRCHAKTIYVRNGSTDAEVTGVRPPEEVRIQSTLPEDLVDCRRIVDTIGDTWLSLDESQFCKRCSPDVREARLRLIVRHGDEPQPHVTAGVRVEDLLLIQEFLWGSVVHRNSDGDETPLRDHAKRLQVLLGMRSFP